MLFYNNFLLLTTLLNIGIVHGLLSILLVHVPSNSKSMIIFPEIQIPNPDIIFLLIPLKYNDNNMQVRTRALSTTKYIQSKGDILKSAVKLLKPELPLSLRLMGNGYL